jgi:DNA sulfur modification protein DndE
MSAVSILQPSDIQTIAFRISSDGDAKNTEMMKRLGLVHRYGPARLALSIAISKGKLPKSPLNSSGRVIKGQQLFGEAFDISCWMVLIKSQFPNQNLNTVREFQTFVNSLWEQGIYELDSIWDECGGKPNSFVNLLAENVGINTSGTVSDTETISPKVIPENITYSANAVALTIGGISENARTGEKISWEINKDGNSPIMTFMGGMNSGKTHTAFQMLNQIKEQSDATFLIIDVKGDLSEKAKNLGATEINCLKEHIPLDAFTPLERDENSLNLAALAFRDTFIQVPTTKMGNIQAINCLDATKLAMKRGGKVTLHDIKKEVDFLYEEDGKKPDTLTSCLQELCMFDNFKPEMSLDEFFSKSWSIKINSCTDTQKRLIPFFLIDALWNWYNKSGDSKKSGKYRALKNVLVIDEARTVLQRSQNSLIEIVRQSRSKGGVAVFMSQNPEDFNTKNEDFLSNVGLAVAFNSKADARGLKGVMGESLDLGSLEAGYCFTRISSQGTKPIKVKVWEPN